MSGILMIITIISVTQTAPAAAPRRAAKAGQHPQAACGLYVIGASMRKAPVPPKLKRFASLFRRMPFKMFRGFRLVHSWDLPLSVGKSREYGFTARDSVKLTLRGIEMDKRGKLWFKLRFELLRKTTARAKRRTYDMVLRLLSGKPMFVAGPEERGETLFIGVTCK